MIEHDPVQYVAQLAIHSQLAGHPIAAREALGELDVPQLRRLMQACTAVTSLAAQVAVNINVEAKKNT